MSLDFPFYEELRRRNHPAAKWWRIGDTLYYIGLLPLFPLVPFSIANVIRYLFGYSSFGVMICFLVLSTLSFSVFYCGARLKGHSYSLAAKDGIDVDDY